MTVPTIFEGISEQPEATSLDGLFFAAESADPLDPTVKVPLDLVRDSYRGLWPDTGGSANKGETWQTQVSGTPTGQYFTALQNTTIDPISDDVNWRQVVSSTNLVTVREDLLGPGTQLYMGSDGVSVKVGDTVPAGTTHLRADIGGSPALVTMSPPTSGEVESIFQTGFQIDGVIVKYSYAKQRVMPDVDTMKSSAFLKEGETVIREGYYSPSDGGNAKMLVLSPDNYDGEPDGFRDYYLANGLIAALNPDSLPVDIRSCGAKAEVGFDNSEAINGALRSSNIIVPSGIYEYSSISIPAGATIDLSSDATLELTVDDGLTFDASRYIDIPVTTTGGKGSKTFTVSDVSGISAGDELIVMFKDDVRDQYYITIAQDPNEYGWQGQQVTVSSVTGNTLVINEPLLFNFKSGRNSTVRKVVTEKTTIKNGTLKNSTVSPMHNAACDNLVLKNVHIDCAESKGLRFVKSTSISVVKSSFDNVDGNGALFFGYGVVNSGVVDSEFKYGKNGDAMLIFFAGSNNCITQRNKFFGNDMIGGLYFGAKTWNMQSVDDSFTGGNYGLFSNFGCRDLKVVRPRNTGQSKAGVFLEQSQFVEIDSPRMKLDEITTSAQTLGGVVIKDCDKSVVIKAPHISTGGGRTISAFNSPATEVVRSNFHFYGGELYGGQFNLECPVTNLKIQNVTSDKSISSYFTYEAAQDGEIIGNRVKNGKLRLRSMRYSRIYDNEVDAAGGAVGVEMSGGGTRFCMLKRNTVYNATTAYSVPASLASRYSTAVYPDNMAINCTNYIDNGVGASASFKPSIGVVAPRNFFVPITSGDFTQAQTVAGYRAKGNSAVDEDAWVRVKVSEDLV